MKTEIELQKEWENRERERIVDAMKRAKMDKTKASKLFYGDYLHRTTFNYRLKKYGYYTELKLMCGDKEVK